jgi:hypothetical protein
VVVPNLWGAIIAPPGYMKSPVIQAAIGPLLQIQTEWRQEHDAALKEYTHTKEECELRRAAWKEQYKANTKKGKSAPERPGDQPEEPRLRRLIVNDATFEALHQMMSENPAGILVVRDELTDWWSQLDRAGREGERAFCLEAWNGDTGRTIDRIGRGSIHVEACCMSMLGGIQPGRLRSYLVDALRDGPANDGLIQRFQVMVWPDTEPEWTCVDRPPDAASEEQAARVFPKLMELELQWPDIHLEPAAGAKLGYLHVREGKSRNAKRNVSLTSRVREILAARQAQAQSVYVFPGYPNEGKPGSKPYRGTSLNHQHQKVRALLKLPPDFVLHSFRHTMLTRLGEAGVDAFTVMRIARHSSVTVSQGYVHPTPETQERAIEKLEASNGAGPQDVVIPVGIPAEGAASVTTANRLN